MLLLCRKVDDDVNIDDKDDDDDDDDDCAGFFSVSVMVSASLVFDPSAVATGSVVVVVSVSCTAALVESFTFEVSSSLSASTVWISLSSTPPVVSSTATTCSWTHSASFCAKRYAFI